ncbi:MAG: hypothetical protein COW03_13500 [Cytophagales bacterium CG12_big_fil_rev_8_21_14_0_65_40_12]|nr:MAG: hypothetical protein COW03_13500 [Cytophagales bacterium CG12_big_fil_rev_8_21_14_0_65_40_12]PIW03572.1 MAG: hypothetical protein COW40_14135 [Cytophagales bacterium CG17_big_fil_post_rev_8_21_14_2_50_40_13]
MKKSENEIDDLIHQALNKEEAAYYDQLGEQNLPQMVFGLFKGRNGWLNVVMVIITFAILGVMIFTIIEMLKAEDLGDKMEWMFYSLLGFITIVLMKIWSWNQLDKNAILRELKRLEYQVALLQSEKAK